MDSASIIARSTAAPWLVQMVRLTAPEFTVRWSTGSVVKWGDQEYEARPAIGTLGDLPVFEDGIDNQTTRASFTVYPADAEALANLAQPSLQNSLVEAWEASIDPDFGTIIGTPDPLFRGLYDFPRIIVGDRLELIMECGTEEALLNEPNEDRRLSHPFHTSIWPGELGLIFVTGLGRKIYWRQNQPSSVSGGGGYVSGGGGAGSVSQY